MFITPHEYFKLQGLRPRKRFGQHFLTQSATASRIVASADLERSEVAVEVGPGLGALTRFILPSVQRLHLVELDRDLADHLKRAIPHAQPSSGDRPPGTHAEDSNPAEVLSAEAASPEASGECQVFLHQQDVLTFDFLSLGQSEGRTLVVLGNLPYNISSPLIFQLLESRAAIKRAVFMMQKEVGDRLAAVPGTKDYGVLSVLLGVYARVSRLFLVGPGQFYPPPKVDSLVLRIDFGQEPPGGAPSFNFLRNVVNTAFQQRRKTLQNSLKSRFAHMGALLEEAFALCAIDPKRRPETLSAEEFVRLAKVLENR